MEDWKLSRNPYSCLGICEQPGKQVPHQLGLGRTQSPIREFMVSTTLCDTMLSN